MYPDNSDICKQSGADHTHMFWTYTNLTAIRHQMFITLGKVFAINLNPEPAMAFFVVPPPEASNFQLAFITLDASFYFSGSMLFPLIQLLGQGDFKSHQT